MEITEKVLNAEEARKKQALQIVSTVAIVSVALSLRKLARTNVGALQAANELVRLQTVTLQAYNIPV